MTVAGLANLAKEAGALAAQETEAAKQASDQAVNAARLAKEAAERAEAETKAAKDNSGRDALAPYAPAVNGEVSVKFSGGRAEVSIDRDAYPDLEVIQYRPDHEARFLVQDTQTWAGPGAMVPLAPNSTGTWIDGVYQ